MEEVHHNCVMCRRGLHNGRYQQHLLTDALPRERPEVVAYIQERAVLEVSIILITYGIHTYNLCLPTRTLPHNLTPIYPERVSRAHKIQLSLPLLTIMNLKSRLMRQKWEERGW